METKKTKKPWVTIAIIAVIILFMFSSGKGAYNGMVTKGEGVNGQWANVENVYQRRADLIPNLVNTVKGYAAHEQETFTAVVEARAKATGISINADQLNPETIQQFQKAQSQLSSALSKLLVVVERYPDLKANQNFLDLQVQLESTENRIATERRKFNEMSKEYNTFVRVFPKNLWAKLFKFEQKPYYEAVEGSDKAPVVEF
jgi:LemA protein